MLKSMSLVAVCVKKYMLKPVARCRAGCRIHDTRCMVQDEKEGVRIQVFYFILLSPVFRRLSPIS